jgi:hypothetical protein
MELPTRQGSNQWFDNEADQATVTAANFQPRQQHGLPRNDQQAMNAASGLRKGKKRAKKQKNQAQKDWSAADSFPDRPANQPKRNTAKMKRQAVRVQGDWTAERLMTSNGLLVDKFVVAQDGYHIKIIEAT